MDPSINAIRAAQTTLHFKEVAACNGTLRCPDDLLDIIRVDEAGPSKPGKVLPRDANIFRNAPVDIGEIAIGRGAPNQPGNGFNIG